MQEQNGMTISDEEWENLADEIEQYSDLNQLQSSDFVQQIVRRQQNSFPLVLQGQLEGAMKLRPLLKVIMNVITIKRFLD